MNCINPTAPLPALFGMSALKVAPLSNAMHAIRKSGLIPSSFEISTVRFLNSGDTLAPHAMAFVGEGGRCCIGTEIMWLMFFDDKDLTLSIISEAIFEIYLPYKFE